MKSLPTVVVSRNGEHALKVLQFDGADGVRNRDAVAYYFTAQDRDGERIRFGVVFSGTVLAVRPQAFGLPEVGDRNETFSAFSLAALGDHLDAVGMLAPTPPGSSAHWIECFSPHFQGWADREPVDDAAVEQYLGIHLYEAWRAEQQTWELGVADLLRLARTMPSVERLVSLGEGELWEILSRSEKQLGLKPLKALIRTHQSTSVPPAVLLPSETLTEQAVSLTEPDEPAAFVYVDEARLADLRRLNSGRFDFRKTIALCEELNICYRSQCYHAVAALTRALLDHVPPVFGCKNFAEVANNYAVGKSLKACLGRLEGSARNIADMHLHQVIRKTESLPNRTQVNFSNDIDMLLAEVIRIVEETRTEPDSERTDLPSFGEHSTGPADNERVARTRPSAAPEHAGDPGGPS